MATVGKKLLVADDSLTIQKVIRLALSNEGYEIQAVSDGNDAIQQIALFRPDIVLIDVSLPGKTAFEVKRSVNEQEEFAETRFILMSSAFEKFDEAEAKRTVFHGRLTKPFDPAHLRQVIADALQQVREKRLDQTSILTRPLAEALNPASSPSLFPPIPPTAPETAPQFPSVPSAGPSLFPEIPTAPSLKSPEPGPAEISIPITPIAVPVIPAPPAPHEETLWSVEEATQSGLRLDTLGSAEQHTPPPIQTAPIDLEPLPTSKSQETEGDIRHLTESTIRSSGLDEFNWSVNEPLKAAAPSAVPSSIAPPPSGHEGPFAPIQLVPPPAHFVKHPEPQEALLPPPPSFRDLGGATFQLDDLPPNETWGSPSATGIGLSPAPVEPLPIPPPPPYPPLSASSPLGASSHGSEHGSTNGSGEAMAFPLSAAQMEDLLAKQVEQSLEKMMRQMLPDLAERILKQEIHKMLMEQQ